MAKFFFTLSDASFYPFKTDSWKFDKPVKTVIVFWKVSIISYKFNFCLGI